MFENYSIEELNKGLEVAKSLAEKNGSEFYMNMALQIAKELSKRA